MTTSHLPKIHSHRYFSVTRTISLQIHSFENVTLNIIPAELIYVIGFEFLGILPLITI